jgi:hypothetical protein
MKTYTHEMRSQMKKLQAEHQRLGDAYLKMCECSLVEPLPVAWQTIPPTLDGETHAFVFTAWDDDSATDDQVGFDVHAPTRDALVEAVFLKVLTRSCGN